MHVGLNLIYLVPEPTAGMEVSARDLVPRLAETPGAPDADDNEGTATC